VGRAPHHAGDEHLLSFPAKRDAHYAARVLLPVHHGKLSGSLTSGAQGFNELLDIIAVPLDVTGRLLEERRKELPAAPGLAAGSVAFHPDMQDEPLLHFFKTTQAVQPLWQMARFLVTTAYREAHPGGVSGDRWVDVQAAGLLKDMFARRSQKKFKHLLGPLSMLLMFGGLSRSVMASLARMGPRSRLSAQGGAVQVESIKSRVESAPGFSA
jgi:hypothetical protein